MESTLLLEISDDEEETLDSLNQDRDAATNTTEAVGQPLGFKGRVWVLIPVVILYCCAGGIYLIALPQYTQLRMKEKDLPKTTEGLSEQFNMCNQNTSNPAYENYIKVQQDTATWTIYFSLATLVPGMVGNIVFPSISDVIGRRIVIIISFVGAAIKCGIFACVVQFEWHIGFIIIGQFIDGLTGGFITILATTFSIACDVTNVGRRRTIAIIMFDLLLGLTFTLVAFASGYVMTSYGFFYPALASTIFAVIGSVVGLFMKETSPCVRQASYERTSLRSRILRSFESILEAFKFYLGGDSTIRRVKYLLLISGFLFFTIPYINRGTMETLYQLGTPFCWNPTKIGYFSAVKMGVASLLGVTTAYILQKCMKDDTIAAVTAAAGIASYVVEGLAQSDAILYLIPVLSVPTGLPIPMIRSVMSSLTPSDKQGALFASIAAVETLCALIGSLTNNIIYSATVSVMSGFVFLIMSGLSLVSVVFLVIYLVVNRRYKDPGSEIVIPVDA